MSKKGSHVLQEYLDDLLLDDLSPPALPPKDNTPPASASPPEPAPTVQRQSLAVAAQTHVLTAAEELAVLEQSKREKLQALLNSKPLAPTPAAKTAAATPLPPDVVPVEAAEQSPAAIDEPLVDSVQMDSLPVDSPAAGEPQEVPESGPAVDSTVSPFLDWHENGRPHWAQKRFDALLFNVSGLTLAVPLIALGQIQPLNDELTPLFGQAAWFMGLMPTPAGKIRTVNTALFVMPERYDPSFVESAKYVVSIDGLPWGLAVDSIAQPVSLDPHDVKWRSERSKRPWLAGTVKSAMCALIDIPQMGKMLNDADKNKA